MTDKRGTFATLRAELAPMEWAEIVNLVSDYARTQGVRWDDAARQLATAARDTDTP
jgi:DNA polymerase III delta subunit